MTDRGSPERHPGLRRRGTWFAALAVVVVVAGLGLWVAGRSDSDPDSVAAAPGGIGDDLDEVDGVPVLAGAYRTEGDLADGVALPPGTALLGDVLPADDILPPAAPDYVPGWRAFLLVTGDMAAVLYDLDRQAAALGFQPHRDEYLIEECVVTDYQPPEGLTECRRGWESRSAWLAASLQRGVVPAGAGSETARPVSLLTVELGRLAPGGTTTSSTPASESGPPATAPTPSTTIVTPTTLVAPGPPATTPVEPLQASRAPWTPPTTTPDAPMPEDWPEPPGPGDSLGEGIVPVDDQLVLSLRLPDGAAAVVAPWPTGGNAMNYAAIVAVTGDLDAVMADLVAQVEERFPPTEIRDATTEVEGSPLREVHGDEAGGSKLDIVAVTVDGRSWVTVATGYD